MKYREITESKTINLKLIKTKAENDTKGEKFTGEIAVPTVADPVAGITSEYGVSDTNRVSGGRISERGKFFTFYEVRMSFLGKSECGRFGKWQNHRSRLLFLPGKAEKLVFIGILSVSLDFQRLFGLLLSRFCQIRVWEGRQIGTIIQIIRFPALKSFKIHFSLEF